MLLNNKKTIRIISMTLLVVCCLGFAAPIASAEGSPYIGYYSAGMTAGSNGKVTVSFMITSSGSTLDEIGATTVYLFENGVQIKTYSYTSTSGMMAYNTFFHGMDISYNGTIGKTYYAFVVYKAGSNGDWDNRSLTSNTVTAKN